MQNTIVTLKEMIDNLNNANLDHDLAVFEIENSNRNHSGVFYPIRFDALIVLFCIDGKMKINIDMREYSISRNSLIVLQPQNYIVSDNIEQDTSMIVVACSKRIMQDAIPKLTDLLPLLTEVRTDPVTKLSDTDSSNYLEFVNFLKKFISRPSTPNLKRSVICLLQSALYLLIDSHSQSEKTDNLLHRTRKDELFAKFMLLVSQNFRRNRQVSWYADQLCITPKHLSTVVKTASGHTAGEWIENYVVMEAKVLLRTTDLTIQQIASDLNFVNQSFFGKYFKHITGISPTQFRKS